MLKFKWETEFKQTEIGEVPREWEVWKMASLIRSENKIVIPTAAIIYLIEVIIVTVQHLGKLSFGILGVISWIIVTVGAAYFVLGVLAQLFG